MKLCTSICHIQLIEVYTIPLFKIKRSNISCICLE